MDHKEAIIWFDIAAKQGNRVAQYRLAMLHFVGHPEIRNFVKAHMWFSIAAYFGDKYSDQRLKVIEALMSPSQILESNDLTTPWLSRFASNTVIN